ncbi:hypothetical protein DFP72DRAFT_856601 [Ephemerocybe angulata]|uniref:Uncharacterized protein n=1 Tax=Ephemerocybe angulata TaxID=980116 RepID=A0A8H6LX42_9AGAR|nr:hypothetical protein DFP72DRAFT_856601 [Tulosesus angulatus]
MGGRVMRDCLCAVACTVAESVERAVGLSAIKVIVHVESHRSAAWAMSRMKPSGNADGWPMAVPLAGHGRLSSRHCALKGWGPSALWPLYSLGVGWKPTQIKLICVQFEYCAWATSNVQKADLGISSARPQIDAFWRNKRSALKEQVNAKAAKRNHAERRPDDRDMGGRVMGERGGRARNKTSGDTKNVSRRPPAVARTGGLNIWGDMAIYEQLHTFGQVELDTEGAKKTHRVKRAGCPESGLGDLAERSWGDGDMGGLVMGEGGGEGTDIALQQRPLPSKGLRICVQRYNARPEES